MFALLGTSLIMLDCYGFRGDLIFGLYGGFIMLMSIFRSFSRPASYIFLYYYAVTKR
jgi:hypothetical protein